MAAEPVTLALLYEDELLCTALARILGAMPGYRLLQHVGDTRALKRAAAVGQHPRVYLLGLATAMADDRALLYWCRLHLPDTYLVLLGQHPEPADLLAAIPAGANAFVCTRDGEATLGRVLDCVVDGGQHWPTRTWDQLRTALCHRSAPPGNSTSTLTGRQRELLRWKADGAGYTNKDIAERMHISESAVEKLCKTICAAHDLKGRAALVVFAAQQGG